MSERKPRKVCPYCLRDNIERLRYCPNCGADLLKRPRYRKNNHKKSEDEQSTGG